MVKCAYAKCGISDGLVKRRSERNGDVYHYCEDHDPLDNDASFGFSEVNDDGE